MFKGSVYAVVLCCCITLHAEQVTLKNGDRLTGAIVSVSDKKLMIKTEHAGTISIDWDAVAQFSSEQPMVVTRNDKQVVSGPVSTKDDEVVVTTASGAQEIPMARRCGDAFAGGPGCLRKIPASGNAGRLGWRR